MSPSGKPPRRDLAELLSLIPWARLDRARVLVTGASGLLGWWLVSSLLEAVDRLDLAIKVQALVRDPVGWIAAAPELAGHPRLEILEGDVREFQLPSVPPTHVVHLAAPSPATQRDDPLGTFDVIVSGARRLLELASSGSTKGFLLASTGAVYGRGPKTVERVPEASLEAPDPLDTDNSAYDEGKRAAEALAGLFARHRRVPAVVARIFPVIGPGLPLDGHHAAGNFVRDALAGGPVTVKGDGTPMRSYIYLADVAWWLWTMLLTGRPGRAYNVGGAEAVTILELARRFAYQVSPIPKIVVAGVPGAEPPSRHVPLIDRAHEELGLFPRIDLDEAVHRTLTWARETNRSREAP